MEKVRIIKISNNKKKSTTDLIAEEISLTITISHKEITTLVCSPSNLNELVVGYLFTSGIIQSIKDIHTLHINKNHIASVQLIDNNIIKDIIFKKLQPPGCGGGLMFLNNKLKIKKINSPLRIQSNYVITLMKNFQNRSILFQTTGAVHSAAIILPNKNIIFREDIGRHNAVDKVIGNRLLHHDKSHNKILITSGRISSEIFLKTYIYKIPIIISRSAPTNKAIQQCRKAHITLAGFVRGNKMNIYSAPNRIIIRGATCD